MPHQEEAVFAVRTALRHFQQRVAKRAEDQSQAHQRSIGRFAHKGSAQQPQHHEA